MPENCDRMDARDFLQLRPHAGEELRLEDIIDVNEFEIAEAILNGKAALLGQNIGSCHLFGLCLHFGHHGTAAALLAHGVPGCELEVRHLGPFAGRARPPQFAECTCGSSWHTCPSCCYGFDTETHSWMVDWDAALTHAVEAAEVAAARPTARMVSKALRNGQSLPNLKVSKEASARLLDIAILSGDRALAEELAATSMHRPLRRWVWQDVFDEYLDERGYWLVVQDSKVIESAVAVGASLACLKAPRPSSFQEMPFRVAVALYDYELWKQIGEFLPEEPAASSWAPLQTQNMLAATALCTVSCDRFQIAVCERRLLEMGMACPASAKYLTTFSFLVGCNCAPYEQLAYLTLLDLCLLCGHSTGARLCMSLGLTEMSRWTQSLCLDHLLFACPVCGENGAPEDYFLLAPFEKRQAAARSALQPSLEAAWQHARCEMGINLSQAMRSWACGRVVPQSVLNHVLSFAAVRPGLLKVIDGRETELLHGIQSSPITIDFFAERMAKAAAEQRSANCQQVDAQNGHDDDAPGFPSVEENPLAFRVDESAHAAGAKASGPDQDSTNDLLTAIRNSKDDAPPLSGDGVVIFRFRRRSNTEDVNNILFDPNGPLTDLHRRVLEAGCEVAPGWCPAKALFVPLTQQQLGELLQPEAQGR